jgi:16S rRNA C1402 N4-methylase RsmH
MVKKIFMKHLENKNKITYNYSIPFEEFPKNIYKIFKKNMTPTTDELNRNEKREIFGSYNTNKQTKA